MPPTLAELRAELRTGREARNDARRRIQTLRNLRALWPVIIITVAIVALCFRFAQGAFIAALILFPMLPGPNWFRALLAIVLLSWVTWRVIDALAIVACKGRSPSSIPEPPPEPPLDDDWKEWDAYGVQQYCTLKPWREWRRSRAKWSCFDVLEHRWSRLEIERCDQEERLRKGRELFAALKASP
jgi:hypothetical protein